MADYSNNFSLAYDEASGACHLSFRCFDTPNSVTLYGCEVPDFEAEELLANVRKRCLEFHRLWSFSLPESDISRINQACDSVEVGESTARLLAAMKAFNASEPAFDFTVGPVSYLWKHASALPDDARIEEALAHVGADKVEIDGCRVIKRDPQVQVDIGGAAKGFAADTIAMMLREAGVTCADIDFGGNLFMIGSHPSGRPWRVSVRDPRAGSTLSAGIIEVVDQSVVTSGSYERFVEIDGVRYQHIIDARTGYPSLSDVVSATVVCESSLIADMLATTALLVDPEKLAGRHPHERFKIIYANTGDTHASCEDAILN